MSRPAWLRVVFALSLVTGSRGAHAAPVPLSAIPVSSDDVPPAVGKERLADVKRVDDRFVTALDRPVCVQGMGEAAALDGTDGIYVDRLELGAEPFLHRVVVDPTSELPEAKVLRRLDIPLVQIVAGPLPVYAYRTQRIVGLLIPRGIESAADAFVHQRGLGTFLREHCGFLYLQLPIAGGVSSTRVLPPRAMLDAERWATDVDSAKVAERKPLPNGRPASAQPWAINASLSKVSRDPEPILSVLVTEPAQSTQKEFGPK